MVREEMLTKLSSLQYCLLWPDDTWEDIGFTERPIWVNQKGYGYIACDEPCMQYEIKSLPTNQWISLHEKIHARKADLSDIENTSIETLLYRWYDLDAIDNIKLNDILQPLLSLPSELDQYFYCAETFCDPIFFASETELYQYESRDDCHCEWTELPDSELILWVNRLNAGNLEPGLLLELIE